MTDIQELTTSKNLLSSAQMIRIINRMLSRLDKNLMTHNRQTAFLALSLAQKHRLNKRCSVQNLVLLALWHTIGFFQQNGLEPYSDRSRREESKYMFGCYYLEFMTPLGRDALCLEYFSHPYNKDLKKYIYQTEYKSILYLCSCISRYMLRNPDSPLPEDLSAVAGPGMLDPEFTRLFRRLNRKHALENAIKDGSYKKTLDDFISAIRFDGAENAMLLKLIVYLLDFKSTFTLKHSINTACYAVALGEQAGLSEADIQKLFISALLHDIGKICTPQEILESPGKLSFQAMEVMRQHVEHSKALLQGIVPDDIVQAVYRHHEKLDGSGYPQKLTADELPKLQRLLTVADITSALIDSRSYKDSLSKHDTIKILKDMSRKGEIDTEITGIMTERLDELLARLAQLQAGLVVDYSLVLQKYNDYVFDDTAGLSDIMSSVFDDYLEEL